MMLTLERSKTPELLDEYKKIRLKYNKILSIIKSCTTIYHIECCYKIINNFEHYCNCTGLPQPTLISRLRVYIKLKRRSIRLT